MANVVTVATPTSIAITGATAGTIPYRFTATAARIHIAGQTATVGPGTGTSLSVTSPVLDRLYRLIDKADGETDKQFQRRQQIWQTTMEAIEGAFAALTTQVSDNAALLNRIAYAQDLAQAANTTAAATQSAISIANSYVSPVNVLTAANTGTITIAAHTRYYRVDGSLVSVAVDAGSVSGFAPNNYVTVYYQDSARAGGAVSYTGTIGAVEQGGNTHVVGQVAIPASGEPPATGVTTPAPGYTPPPTDGTRTYDPDYVEQ